MGYSWCWSRCIHPMYRVQGIAALRLTVSLPVSQLRDTRLKAGLAAAAASNARGRVDVGHRMEAGAAVGGKVRFDDPPAAVRATHVPLDGRYLGPLLATVSTNLSAATNL